MGSVRHFGMELQSENRAVWKLDSGQWTSGGNRQHVDFGADIGDLVAVTHPNDGFVWHTSKKRAGPF